MKDFHLKRLFSLGRNLKRLLRGKKPSKSSTIDDLPDDVLVEILVRLPSNLAVQCKYVCKRWLTLVSDPYFIIRFLSPQSRRKTPIASGMVFTDAIRYYSFTAFSKLGEYLTPLKLSMRYLPTFEVGEPKEEREGDRDREEACVVVATHNDLVLCSWEHYYGYPVPYYYFICNPYTMQWVALPPALRCDAYYFEVGFICDPYYEDNDSMIKVNPDFRCRIVRIFAYPGDACKFYMELFFSETGEWREFVLSCRPYPTRRYFLVKRGRNYKAAGLAHNGKLYWLGFCGIMELDPLSCDSNATDADIANICRFIDFDDKFDYKLHFITVRQGRICLCAHYDDDIDAHFDTWELTGEEDGGGKWCLIKRSSFEFSNFEYCRAFGMDAFEEDTIYQLPYSDIWKINTRTGEIEDARGRPNGHTSPDVSAYPFVLPCWPTPVPRIRSCVTDR